MPEWKSIEEEPPGPEHYKGLFVGHFPGGRIDYVFVWPHPRTGKPAFWGKGKMLNYVLTGYTPNRWYPGPPLIPGSDVERLQKGNQNEAS